MLKTHIKFKIIFVLILLFLNFGIWNAIANENREGEMLVSFLNIGQGDSIFIDTPSGNQILIDGGPDFSLKRKLSPFMNFYDKEIDMLIVSNNDKDHLAGLVDILKNYKVNAVLESGTIPDTSVYREFEKIIKEKNIKKIIGKAGMIFYFGGDVYLNIIFPDRDASGMKTNDGSLVAKLVYGNTSILFTGDMPSNVEKYLIEKGIDLNSDILKVGHHGSRTSSSEIFLGFVSPDFSVISSALKNSYGHPHKETMERLSLLGGEIFNTAINGNIKFISDGESFVRNGN